METTSFFQWKTISEDRIQRMKELHYFIAAFHFDIWERLLKRKRKAEKIEGHKKLENSQQKFNFFINLPISITFFWEKLLKCIRTCDKRRKNVPNEDSRTVVLIIWIFRFVFCYALPSKSSYGSLQSFLLKMVPPDELEKFQKGKKFKK